MTKSMARNKKPRKVSIQLPESAPLTSLEIKIEINQPEISIRWLTEIAIKKTIIQPNTQNLLSKKTSFSLSDLFVNDCS